jgi:hypothetical protein
MLSVTSLVGGASLPAVVIAAPAAVTVAMAVPADGSEHWGNTTRGSVYWTGSSIDQVPDAQPWSPTAGVPVAQTPVIAVFTAPTNSITAGEQVRLTWNVQNADSIEIRTGDNFLIVQTNQLQGSVIDIPPSPTTYILTATNAGGKTTKDFSVDVKPLTDDD